MSSNTSEIFLHETPEANTRQKLCVPPVRRAGGFGFVLVLVLVRFRVRVFAYWRAANARPRRRRHVRPFAGDGADAADGVACGAERQEIGQVHEMLRVGERVRQVPLQPHDLRQLHLARHLTCQSINQLINQSIKQLVSQSVKQSLTPDIVQDFVFGFVDNFGLLCGPVIHPHNLHTSNRHATSVPDLGLLLVKYANRTGQTKQERKIDSTRLRTTFRFISPV